MGETVPPRRGSDRRNKTGTTGGAPVRRLWLAVLCGYLALGASLQALPGYVTTRFHGGPLLVGVSVGIAFAATAAVRPFSGRLGDGGWSRPTVLVGGALTALGGIGQLLAPDVAILLIARLLMGAGEAALFSGALPWVITGTPSARRGRVAGWFGLSMWGGLAGGPALAALLAAWRGTTVVWWGVVGLSVASAVLVSCTRSQPWQAERPRIRPSGWRDLVPKGAPLPGIGLGLAGFGYGAINALLVLFLRTDRLGGDGVALAVFAAGFLLCRALGSPLVDRLGGAQVALVCLAIEALGLTLLATAGDAALALLGAAVTGIGVALVYPATVWLTLHRTGPLRPGASLGVMTSFWDLGLLAAGPVSGAIAAGPGFRFAFWFAVAVTGAAALVIEAVRRSPMRPPAPAP